MNKKVILTIVLILLAIGAGFYFKDFFIEKEALQATSTEPSETTSTGETPKVPSATSIPSESPNEERSLSSCIVLEKEYCDKGKTLKEGPGFVKLGFDLKSEAKVYSPFEGKLSIDEIQPAGYKVVDVHRKARGSLYFENLVINPDLKEEMENGSNRVIKLPPDEEGERNKLIRVQKGEMIGKTSPNFYLGEYNLWVGVVTSADPEKFMLRYFPYIDNL